MSHKKKKHMRDKEAMKEPEAKMKHEAPKLKPMMKKGSCRGK